MKRFTIRPLCLDPSDFYGDSRVESRSGFLTIHDFEKINHGSVEAKQEPKVVVVVVFFDKFLIIIELAGCGGAKNTWSWKIALQTLAGIPAHSVFC